MSVTINQATFPLNAQGGPVLPQANSLAELHERRDEVRLAGFASSTLDEVGGVLSRMVAYDNSPVDANPEAGKVVYGGAAESSQPSNWIDLQAGPESFDCELTYNTEEGMQREGYLAGGHVDNATIYTPSRMDRQSFVPGIVGESKITYSNADGKETIRVEMCSHGTNNYTLIRDHHQNTLTVISEFERER